MGLFEAAERARRPRYTIPGVDGPVTVRCIADVDRILVELVAAARDEMGKLQTSVQTWEELDIVLDARLYFMK